MRLPMSCEQSELRNLSPSDVQEERGDVTLELAIECLLFRAEDILSKSVNSGLRGFRNLTVSDQLGALLAMQV